MAYRFEPCAMDSAMGDTEIILQDCLMVWRRWDERTEVAETHDGLLVGVRLIGYASESKEAGDG